MPSCSLRRTPACAVRTGPRRLLRPSATRAPKTRAACSFRSPCIEATVRSSLEGKAAAHRTTNFAFGTSVPARSAASSSSNGQRPAEFRPRPSPAQIFAALNAKAAAAVAAKAASAAEDSNQAERALAPLHAAAAAAVSAKATDAAEESRRAELARAPLAFDLLRAVVEADCLNCQPAG